MKKLDSDCLARRRFLQILPQQVPLLLQQNRMESREAKAGIKPHGRVDHLHRQATREDNFTTPTTLPTLRRKLRLHQVDQSASNNQSEIREDQIIADEVALDLPLAVLEETEQYLLITDISSTRAGTWALMHCQRS